jgi:hypothetical protein
MRPRPLKPTVRNLFITLKTDAFGVVRNLVFFLIFNLSLLLSISEVMPFFFIKSLIHNGDATSPRLIADNLTGADCF